MHATVAAAIDAQLAEQMPIRTQMTASVAHVNVSVLTCMQDNVAHKPSVQHCEGVHYWL